MVPLIRHQRARGVASMFNNALKSEKLYDEMRAAGYADDEFPLWWFSPARDEGQLSEIGQVIDEKGQLYEVRTQVGEVK